MKLRVLQNEYAYDHRLASCNGLPEYKLEACPLLPFREKSECPAQRPGPEQGFQFNGLMFIGEGPGVSEARFKVPFVGRSGQLLDAMLTQVGIERANCVVSNATLCLPSYNIDKEEALPHAVPLCNERLLEEIHAFEPRVIVTLGQHALTAIAGAFTEKTVRVPISCEFCEGSMTLPWEKCTNTKGCSGPKAGKNGQFFIPPGAEPVGGTCPDCEEGELVVQPKRKRCPECGGKKTRKELIHPFETDHRATFVAGGVFRRDTFGDVLPASVKYIIPTYHPAFLLRGNEGEAKGAEGQFLVSAALKHLAKARRLLSEDADWSYRYRVTADLSELRKYVEQYAARAPFFSVDIETDAKDPWDVTEIRCIGVHAAGVTDEALVLDTRGVFRGHPDIGDLAWFLEDERFPKCFQNGSYDIQVIDRLW